MTSSPYPSYGRAKKLMGPMPKKIEEASTSGGNGDFPPQQKYNEKGDSSGQKGKAYLRLHLRVEDKKMSLIEAQKVDGPLIIEDRIDSNLVYEAVVSSKRIALGNITDVGVNRSFPNPNGVPGQEGHFFVELPSYEFDARLRAEDLSPSLLPEVEITVYNVREQITNIIGKESLAQELRNEVHELARLKGIKIESLSQRSQTEIHNLFR
jgi:hypothetical protein